MSTKQPPASRPERMSPGALGKLVYLSDLGQRPNTVLLMERSQLVSIDITFGGGLGILWSMQMRNEPLPPPKLTVNPSRNCTFVMSWRVFGQVKSRSR